MGSLGACNGLRPEVVRSRVLGAAISFPFYVLIFEVIILYRFLKPVQFSSNHSEFKMITQLSGKLGEKLDGMKKLKRRKQKIQKQSEKYDETKEKQNKVKLLSKLTKEEKLALEKKEKNGEKKELNYGEIIEEKRETLQLKLREIKAQNQKQRLLKLRIYFNLNNV